MTSTKNYFTGRDQGFVRLYERSGTYTITANVNGPTKWSLDYAAFPQAVVALLDNHGNVVPTENNAKYLFEVGSNKIVLEIKDVELNDAGVYKVKAENTIESKVVDLVLIVEDKPSLILNDQYIYAREDEESQVACVGAGYPESVITWSFMPCDIDSSWTKCHEEHSFEINPIHYETITMSKHSQTSTLRFKFPYPGLLICIGENEKGKDSVSAKVALGDLKKDFDVWGVAENSPIAIGEELKLECGALVYNFSGPVKWYKNNQVVHADPQQQIEVFDLSTNYSIRKAIHFMSLRSEDAGTYECRAQDLDRREHQVELYLDVQSPEAPILEDSNMDEENPVYVDPGATTEFFCHFAGLPRPVVRWFKDDVLIEPENDPNATIQLYDEGTLQRLYIKYTKPVHQGQYKCEATNKVGTVSRSTILGINGMTQISKYLLYGIPAAVIILFLAFLVLCFRYRKTKRVSVFHYSNLRHEVQFPVYFQKLMEMKAAGLANFEEGNPECINPALSLDEQADLLPYNKDFEFPREDLKLGKQLGAGAFGIVVKAVAKGIVHYEEETTVAVKMVKPNTDNEVMRALISELKIMVHLGRHVNVVNLLGAVTKDIAKRELNAFGCFYCNTVLTCFFISGKVMVIVEYCRFGNVQNFLQKHREDFIDQVNPETDVIDHTIVSKEQRWSNDSGYEYNR